jgi:hypothetical protein
LCCPQCSQVCSQEVRRQARAPFAVARAFAHGRPFICFMSCYLGFVVLFSLQIASAASCTPFCIIKESTARCSAGSPRRCGAVLRQLQQASLLATPTSQIESQAEASGVLAKGLDTRSASVFFRSVIEFIDGVQIVALRSRFRGVMSEVNLVTSSQPVSQKRTIIEKSFGGWPLRPGSWPRGTDPAAPPETAPSVLLAAVI